MTRFHVLDWMASAPDRTERADWLAWAGLPVPPQPEPQRPRVPAPLRRRLKQAGLLAAEAVFGLGPVAREPRFVFCSRHGEFQRNLNLLFQLVKEEPLSPTDFSLSVHNAIAGLISIATGNRAGHTAIAAGPDSFQAGLLEAAALLATRAAEPVLLVYYDEPLPPPFEPFRRKEETALGLALLLAAEGAESAIEMAPPERRPAGLVGPGPELPALAFLRFLLTGEAKLELAGRRHLWRWRRVA